MRQQVESSDKHGLSGGTCRDGKGGWTKIAAAQQHERHFPNRVRQWVFFRQDRIRASGQPALGDTLLQASCTNCTYYTEHMGERADLSQTGNSVDTWQIMNLAARHVSCSALSSFYQQLLSLTIPQLGSYLWPCRGARKHSCKNGKTV
jgi:hypothetical protein